ncbi:MAG: hypothetical protein ACT4OZ_06370 [Gemmatimonadota bacterium]
MTTVDFVSAEEPSSTGFNIRFTGLIPTRWSLWTLMLGASVTPYGRSGTGGNANAPMVFAGNMFPIVGPGNTGGWLRAAMPVLATYTLDGGSDANQKPYGRDLAVELDVSVFVGQKIFEAFGGPLSRIEAYALLHQNLTPNPGISGRRDRFNPEAFYGVSLPFGYRRGAK